MSTFADLCAAGYAAAESALGVAVRIDGCASTTLRGILDQSTHRQELGDGGFAPEASAQLTLSKAQLDAVWIPALGTQLTVSGRKYKVIAITEDDASWGLGLMATHQQRRAA